jgi:hypothetical protein
MEWWRKSRQDGTNAKLFKFEIVDEKILKYSKN